MMKYTCPEFKIEDFESSDVITSSSSFIKTENAEQDKVEYKTTLDELLFGIISKYQG